MPKGYKMRKVKRVEIKKSPVKVTSISMEQNVLQQLGRVSSDMGYTKSALTNKVLKEWLEDKLTEKAKEEQEND